MTWPRKFHLPIHSEYLILTYYCSPTKKRKKDEADDFDETPKKKVKRALPDNVDKCKAAIERVEVSINKWIIKKTEKVPTNTPLLFLDSND